MAPFIPTTENTFRRYMDDYHSGGQSASNPVQTAFTQQSAEIQHSGSILVISTLEVILTSLPTYSLCSTD